MAMERTVVIPVSSGVELWPMQVIREIQTVMEAGERAGKSGWEQLSPETHARAAYNHLKQYFANDFVLPSEDHLAHAFTRLMMALAIQRGYVKENDHA